ncbi:MAG: activator of ATPase 1 family protein [Glaciihabitans sp.]|nr:activator of ATPase 1 family protein [Glaciihabitans sp.]
MPVVNVEKDPDALTLTFVAEFDAPIDRVWQLWKDPRQLERWWGPPTYPATFHRYEFTVGGEAEYYMTGPDGEQPHGWWDITAIEEPTRLEFDDGFADENGARHTEMGSAHGVVTLESRGSGTRMTTTTHFASLEQMQQMVEMGMEEGMNLAMGQIDGILAEVSV